jgi:inosine-uridine nucleoside N-ribohydrolase
MHDVCAIVPYVDDSLIEYVHTSARIELAGTHARGMTVCDLRNLARGAAANVRHPRDPNARVGVDVISRKLIDLVIETLLTYD